jgi:hypothetical protein
VSAAASWLADTLWPAVWGNLLASALWALPTWAGLLAHHRSVHRKLDRQHLERMRSAPPAGDGPT